MSLFHNVTHAVSCRDATRLMSQMQDRPLRFREWVNLRLHLLVCAACTRFERQMRTMRAAMSKFRE